MIYRVSKKLGVILLVVISSSLSYSSIYAHTFTTNESVLFLALVDKIKAQAELIKQFVIANDNESANEHAKLLKQMYTNYTNKEIEEKNERVANELSSVINKLSSFDLNNMTILQIISAVNDLDGSLEEAISVRIDPDVLKNSTNQALRLSNLVNEIDVNYANAFNVEPHKVSTPSTENTTNGHALEDRKTATTTTTSGHQESQTMNRSETNVANRTNGQSIDTHDANISNTSKNIQNLTAYYTSLEISHRLSDVFEKIKNDKETSDPDKVNQLKTALDNLVTVIEMKKPYMDAVKLIHGTIQPTLQDLYNLKVDVS